MAVDDEKISNNRRRLFKALSAAPVVMTLRPSTAAASSAYQCLIDPPVPTTPVYLDSATETCGMGDSGCAAYVLRDYWVAPTPPCRMAWEAVVGADQNGQTNIVIYDSLTSELRKVTLPDYTFSVIEPEGWTVTGSQLRFTRQGGQTCLLDAHQGYFLLKIQPNSDNTDFKIVGPVPEAVGDAAWESCWNSFGKSTDGVSFIRG